MWSTHWLVLAKVGGSDQKEKEGSEHGEARCCSGECMGASRKLDQTRENQNSRRIKCGRYRISLLLREPLPLANLIFLRSLSPNRNVPLLSESLRLNCFLLLIFPFSSHFPLFLRSGSGLSETRARGGGMQPAAC